MRIKKIKYSSRFLRAMKSIGGQYKEAVFLREQIFKSNCFDTRLKTHKLKGGLKGYWSFSLTYSHRVLFEFIDKETVGFIDVGNHSIYK